MIMVEHGVGLGAPDVDLAHVGQIEQPCGGSDGSVLGELADVLQRHLPTGEVGEVGVQRLVFGEQRGRW